MVAGAALDLSRKATVALITAITCNSLTFIDAAGVGGGGSSFVTRLPPGLWVSSADFRPIHLRRHQPC